MIIHTLTICGPIKVTKKLICVLYVQDNKVFLSVVRLTMKKQTEKGTPLTRKIKLLLPHKKGKQVHKLYPKEYFCQCWFDEPEELLIPRSVQAYL